MYLRPCYCMSDKHFCKFILKLCINECNYRRSVVALQPTSKEKELQCFPNNSQIMSKSDAC